MNEQMEMFPETAAAPESQVYVGARGGFIKIGMSANPLRRARQLRMRLLFVMPGGVTEERELHRRFRPAHIDREWFLPTPELLCFLAEQLAA